MTTSEFLAKLKRAGWRVKLYTNDQPGIPDWMFQARNSTLGRRMSGSGDTPALAMIHAFRKYREEYNAGQERRSRVPVSSVPIQGQWIPTLDDSSEIND